MKLASTLARRSLLVRPGRTLFSILGIAVGIATVVGVFTLDHNTLEGMRRKLAGDWKPDLEVRASRDVGDPAAALASIDGIERVAAFFQNEVLASPLVPASTGGQPADGVPKRRVVLFAADAQALAELDAYSIVAGSALGPARAASDGATAPGALIGADLARRLELEVGDPIVLQAPKRRARGDCVGGERVAAPSQSAAPALACEVVGLLGREKLGRRAHGDVVVVDHPTGLELFADTAVESRFWVRKNPEVDIERVQSELGRNFAYDIGRSVLVGQTADERAFRNGVRMAGLLALVLGLYVIFHTLSMSIVERVREIATLQALGATRGQTARIFFLEALVLAGLGGVLGLAGGLGLARLLLAFGITTLGADNYFRQFDVPWSAALALTALGVTVALLGAVYPLVRASALSTSAVLRGEESYGGPRESRGFHLFATLLLVGLLPGVYFVVAPVVGETSGALVGLVLLGVGLLALFVSVPLLVPSVVSSLAALLARPFRRRWPFAGEMAAHAMRNGRRRIAVATSALALVVAAAVGLKSMVRSLHGEIEDWAAAAIDDKLFLAGLPDSEHDELIETLRGAPGVVGVEWNGARTFAPFLLVGLRIDDLPADGPGALPADVRAALQEERGVVLSRRVAQNLGFAVGDVLQAGASEGGVRDFQVAAISDQVGYFPNPDERMYGVVSDRVLAHDYCLEIDRVDRVALVLGPGADPGVTLAALRAALGTDVEGTTGTWIRDWQSADIDRDFFLFDVILGLTALLAGLGVLNGQLLSALERSKELGILKALGTTHRQIAGMVALESAVVGVVGGVLGVLLGSALGPVIVRSLEEVADLHLPLRSGGPWIFVALLGALALALLAGLYPIWRMGRVDAVRAVRTG